MASKYENSSQQLYINTESGFGSIGDQVNRWKVDLNTSPFENNDNTILRASVSQFNMTKNFYNINETNDAFRITWEHFVSPGSITVNDLDVIVHIINGDYTTHDQLVMALFNAIAPALNSAISGATTVTFATSNAEASMPATHRNYALQSRDDSAGRLYTLEPPDSLWFQGSFTASDDKFRFTNLPVIQCLSVATNEALFTRSNYEEAPVVSLLEPIDSYNDSYILFGGRRIETYEDVADGYPTTQSFSVKSTDHFLYLQNWFPMNNKLNTCPYLYLRSRNSRTQASSNLEEKATPHNHTMVNSSILAKIPRFVDRDGGVSYTLENSPYFTNITQHNLNSIEFELTDAKGRSIPEALTSQAISSLNAQPVPDGVKQNKDSNSFVDMVILVEKFAFQSQNNLAGYPSAPPPIDTNRFSNNPNMSINPNLCI